VPKECRIDPELCIGCGICVAICPSRVLELRDNRAILLNTKFCIKCGKCVEECPAKAIIYGKKREG
jgi:NAD-dependent dihydropyrimidine dehydrogenase PreA subunit